MAKTMRIWSAVTIETMAKLDHWSNRLGVNRSQLINMCVLAGLDSIIRAIAPTETFTPEQWAELIEKMQQRGMEVDRKE